MPHLFFIAREHHDRMATYWLEGPADLAVEIIADDRLVCDRVEKFAEYAEAGIPEYWLFDSRPGTVLVELFHLGVDGCYHATAPDHDGCYYSQVLPLFWLDPEWLQQEPLPDPLATIKRIAPEALRAYRDALK